MSSLPGGRACLHVMSWCLLALGLTAMTGQAGAETGISKSRILIGQSAPFSGPSAELGLQFHRGARAYFDMVNAGGGVYGRQIVLITADDEYEPEKAVLNTRRLIEHDKVFALFGSVGGLACKAALPLINKAGIPFFAPVSGAQFLREPFNPLIFNIRASYAVEIDYMLKQLAGNGKSRIAVFYHDDELGLATLAMLENKLKARNMAVLTTVAVPRNSQDVAAAGKALAALHPEIVIQIGTYVSSSALIKRMREADYKGGFYNFSFVGTMAFVAAVQKAGIGTVITQVMPFPWSRRLPLVYEYQRVYGGKVGEVYSFSSMEGYLAARVLVEGLRRAGRQPTRAKLIQALETIHAGNYDAGGFNIQFTPGNHNGSNYVDITAITRDAKLLN